MAPTTAMPSTAPGERSPIARLLESLGMTREDLTRHSAQMREFLLTENPGALRSLSQSSDKPISSATLSSTQSDAPSKVTRSISESGSQPSQSARSSHPPKTPPPTQARSPNYQRHTSKPPVHISDQASESSLEKRTPRHRKEKERRQTHSATSPTRAKPSLDMIMQMQSNNSRRVYESEESEESDDELMEDVFSSRQGKPRASPHYRYPHPATTSRSSNQSRDQSTSDSNSKHYYRHDSPSISAGRSYYRHRDSFLQPPVTPVTTTVNEQASVQAPSPSYQTKTPTRSYYRQKERAPERLPPSSPIPPSSPVHSSPEYPVNVVSSPGPMSDPPDESDPELPYTLPPGPYSEEKPELSYAALIGRAILASPNHALRLKDIYDYISLVYPYYKRGGNSHSQKWMNAIRQNLTNTPHFSKQEATDRNSRAKGSLWCIRDQDLPCFANGGYSRHANSPFNMQMANAKLERKKRRREEEKQIMESAKRIRVGVFPPAPANPYHFPYGYPQIPGGYSMVITPSTHGQVQSDIIFPPLPSNHPNAHLVNQSQPVTEESNNGIIFPPLPAFSQTRILIEQKEQALSNSQESAETALSDEEHSPVSAPPMSATSSMSEASSIPDLTPNNSSSSPSAPDEEEMFAYPEREGNVQIVLATNVSGEDEEHSQPMEQAIPPVVGDRMAKEPMKDLLSSYTHLPPMPSTPTARGRREQSALLALSGNETEQLEGRPSTPPRPSTPVGRLLSIPYNESLMRTPIGRKTSGERERLVAGPSTKHITSREDTFVAPDSRPSLHDALPKTPTRRVSGGQSSTSFATPRKLFSSPFTSFSPFRTPSRRNVFDATDPSHLLDEELTALASNAANVAGLEDSPVGFFARGKGLLYESPGMPSPNPYRPW